MKCFTAILLDRIPDILLFAAVDNVHDDPGYVAALARVSRLASSIVQPILYRSVPVDYKQTYRVGL